MRTHLLWLLALGACASSSPIPEEATVPEPSELEAPAGTPAATSEPAASAAATEPPTAEEESNSERRWSVESGSANGVKATNEVGQQIVIGALAYTAFVRQSAVVPSQEVENANVTFGTVVADGLTAADVVCRLPGWDLSGDEGAEAVTSGTIVALVAQDAVAVAASFAPPKGVRACGKGLEPRVKWSFADSAIEAVKVTGVSATEASCIEKAVRAAAPMGTGACAATLRL